MISSLLKQVMKQYGLTQKALASILEVNLQRVKDISAGRAHKLTREENEALIRKLHIRGDWLATGEGPMIQSEGEQEFYRRLDAVKSATHTASGIEMSEAKRRLVQEVLFYAQAGDLEALTAALLQMEAVNSDETALLADFRKVNERDRALISRLARLIRADCKVVVK